MCQQIVLLLAAIFSVTFLNACNKKQVAEKNIPLQTLTPHSSFSGSHLDRLKERKKLICGISGKLPGFSYKDDQGNYSGFDVDLCRAIAAAFFNDPKAVEYRHLDNDRFTAISLGEVDILARNTTWTLKRDAAFKVDFTSITFYDGQGIMVRKDSGIKSLKDLNNKYVCVSGTTNQFNLYDQMQGQGSKYYPVKFINNVNAFKGYTKQRCQAFTADRSQLFIRKLSLDNPQQHRVLPEVISKEPLGPAVVDDDAEWFEVVKWVTYALIEAEELGINSTNLETMKQSQNPQIRRFLGLEGDLGQTLGLSNDFTQRIIYHVGNYGEIYDRNLGNKSPFKIPRGLNKLWKNGGLIYSPPFR